MCQTTDISNYDESDYETDKINPWIWKQDESKYFERIVFVARYIFAWIVQISHHQTALSATFNNDEENMAEEPT